METKQIISKLKTATPEAAGYLRFEDTDMLKTPLIRLAISGKLPEKFSTTNFESMKEMDSEIALELLEIAEKSTTKILWDSAEKQPLKVFRNFRN